MARDFRIGSHRQRRVRYPFDQEYDVGMARRHSDTTDGNRNSVRRHRHSHDLQPLRFERPFVDRKADARVELATHFEPTAPVDVAAQPACERPS